MNNDPQAPADADAAPAIDHPVLVERTGGDAELLAEIVALFMAEAPMLFANLEAEVDAGRAAGVQATAHRLKGALADLSAVPAARCANDLEQLGRGGTLDGARAILDRLRDELERATAALRGPGP